MTELIIPIKTLFYSAAIFLMFVNLLMAISYQDFFEFTNEFKVPGAFKERGENGQLYFVFNIVYTIWVLVGLFTSLWYWFAISMVVFHIHKSSAIMQLISNLTLFVIMVVIFFQGIFSLI